MSGSYETPGIKRPQLDVPPITRRNFTKALIGGSALLVAGGVVVYNKDIMNYVNALAASSSQPGLLDGVELPAYLEGKGNRVTMKLPQMTDKWAIELLGNGNEDGKYKYLNIDNNMPGMIYGIDEENEILHVVVDRAFAEENAALVKVRLDDVGMNMVPLNNLINDRPDIRVYFIDVPLSGHDVVAVVNVDSHPDQSAVMLKRQN